MFLYHGSNQIIERPEFRAAAHPLDFGSGFYATANHKQAAEFAKKIVRWRGGAPVVNVYELNETAVLRYQVLHYEKPDADWLRFVAANRSGQNPAVKEDIIIGAVADDNVFRVVELFESGDLTEDEALQRLKIKNLYVQYVFKNQSVLDDVLLFREYQYV